MISAVGLNNYATHDQSRYPELWRGCVGAWAPCLGPTGGRLFDFSRNQNWGTLTNMDNATDWVVSDGRYALDFDGSNDFINVADASSLDITGDVTFAMWIRGSNTSNRVLAEKGTNAAFVLQANGPNTFYFFDGSIPSTVVGISTSIFNGNWQHLACVGRQATRFLYLNSILRDSLGYNPPAENSNPLVIGARANGSLAWQGQLDDIRIYNRALSPAEIRLLATRRGIAYEPARRRRIPQTVAANLRRNHALIGNMF